MRPNPALALILVLLFNAPTSAQRTRRPAKRENKSPVEVTREATLRIAIATDAVTLFEYLSDAKKLEGWFADQAILEGELGGKYHFRWKKREGVWSGVVTDYVRGNTLGLTWQPPDQEYETIVQFKLSPAGSETLLTLGHGGFTSDEALDRAVKDWTFYLENLKSVIEQGVDMRQQPQQRSLPARQRTRKPR